MGITVAHLGDMRSVPPQNEIESLGTVHIVLVPVGGGSGLNAAKAAEIVSLLEPNIVIPMHYSTPATKVPLDQLDKFLKEMGMHEVETVPSLKVTKTSLPDETKLVVLDYQRE
jgi:L-ascorbate metabolism protein UlaG (beta-lactamase superfamily)